MKLPIVETVYGLSFRWQSLCARCEWNRVFKFEQEAVEEAETIFPNSARSACSC